MEIIYWFVAGFVVAFCFARLGRWVGRCHTKRER